MYACRPCVTCRAKPSPSDAAAPAAGGGLAGGGVSSLLYGAASRVERGSATCLQCRGSGSVECSECKGRRVSHQARRGKLGGLFAALKRKLQRADDDTWLQTNRCPRCRGLGRVPCAACAGLGMRVMRGAK